MKNKYQEYLTIPNLMGYFRIFLIPVFLFIFYHADTDTGYIAALIILLLSYLTDFLDGKIARRFDMVTDFGKMLDPVADKLTQGAMAFALIFRYPSMLWIFLMFLGKEIYMGILGLYIIRKGHAVQGAQWFGKICTGILDVVSLLLLFFPNMSLLCVNLLIALVFISMVITWAMYIVFHYRLLHNKPIKKTGLGKIMIIVACIILYLLVGGLVPYLYQPSVSKEYKEKAAQTEYFSDNVSDERAVILEENETALEERIRMISRANNNIILSTFDFHSDDSGKKMIAALLQAAERGVHVKLLVDGFNASLNMESNPFFYALAAEENVTIKVYNSVHLLTPWKGISRMHDKYLVVDDSLYILGGRNTFDYFLGNGQNGYKNYDRDVLVYHKGNREGSIHQLKNYFSSVWEQNYCSTWHNGTWHRYIPGISHARDTLHTLYNDMKQSHPDWFAVKDYESGTVPVNKITLLSNPTSLYSKEPRVFYSLAHLMSQAKKEVCIHTPYVICNDWMYDNFKNICDKGIHVTMMTNSSANNGNPFGAVDYALHKHKILKTGIQMLEYNGDHSYHAKSLTIDDELAVIGSFNMDMKSVYQDTELMLVIQSEELTKQLKDNLKQYQAQAVPGKLVDNEIKNLLTDETVSCSTRLQRFVIKILNPCLRFLF